MSDDTPILPPTRGDLIRAFVSLAEGPIRAGFDADTTIRIAMNTALKTMFTTMLFSRTLDPDMRDVLTVPKAKPIDKMMGIMGIVLPNMMDRMSAEDAAQFDAQLYYLTKLSATYLASQGYLNERSPRALEAPIAKAEIIEEDDE